MSETQAAAPPSLWTNHFYAIMPDAAGTRLLLLPGADGWRLPYVRTEAGLWLADADRIAPVLAAGLGLTFDFTLLRYAAIDVNESERWDRILFVLEPRPAPDDPPLGGQWVDRAALAELPLSLPEQRAPLLRYLEENAHGAASSLIDARRAPWARTGWYAATAAWMEDAAAELGYTLTGPVTQLRNWSISSLLVAPTAAGRVYCKAAADLPLFVDEPALAQTLAALYPGRVPTPLKIDRARRLLLMADFGPAVRGNPAVDLDHARGPALHAFGKLQRDSAAHLDELFAAGCKDRRLPALAGQIDPLLADPLTRAVMAPADFDALVARAPQLKARVAVVAAYDIPSTLLHGDLHLGNVALRDGGYLFFDWTDACIGFPFLDLFEIYFADGDAAAQTRLRTPISPRGRE